MAVQGRDPKQTRSNGKPAAPRAPQARARSRFNARRHGLSVPVPIDFHVEGPAHQLAKALAGSKADACREHFARLAAEVIVELDRIRKTRNALINNDLAAARRADKSNAAAMADLIPLLLKLDRYEARAHARKARALQFL